MLSKKKNQIIKMKGKFFIFTELLILASTIHFSF